MLLLKILGGILALLIGVLLGLAPGKGPSVDEVNERMGKNLPRARVKRHFTIIGLMQKKQERGSHRRRRRTRGPFDLSE
jgi:hypothetical protein